MTTEYVVCIQIEKCEMDGDDCDTIETVGEPREAGRFETEHQAYAHVDLLLERKASSPH